MESKSPKVHEEVYKIFKGYHHKYNRRDSDFYRKNLVGKKISTRLNDLRKSRNKADYDNEFDNLDVNTEYSIIRSREIINTLNSFK